MSMTLNAAGSEQYHVATTSFNYTGITVAAGTNTVLALTLSFGASNVSGISCTWDSGGTNQAMTQKVFQQSSYTSAIFGLRNPTPGNKTLAISWTNNGEIFACAIAFDGADCTSDATAFPHTATNVGTTDKVTLTSASGNMVVGCQSSGTSQGTTTGTQLFNDNVSGAVINAQAEYDNGAATVQVGSSLGNNVTIAAMDIAAAAAAGGGLQNVGVEDGGGFSYGFHSDGRF